MFADLRDFDKFKKYKGVPIHHIEQDFPYIEYSINNSAHILANNIKAKSIELASEIIDPSPHPFLYEILTPTEDVRLFLVFSHLYDDAFQTLSIEDFKSETQIGTRQIIKITETIKMFFMQQGKNERKVFFYSYLGGKSPLLEKLKEVTKNNVIELDGPLLYGAVAQCKFIESRKEKLTKIIKVATTHSAITFLLFLSISVLCNNWLAYLAENTTNITAETKNLQEQEKKEVEDFEKIKKRYLDTKIYCLKAAK